MKHFSNWHQLIQRGLFMAMGYSETSYERPWIAVANTWSELNPGHCHLRQVAEAVKRGIWQAGGTPVEFNTESICDAMSLKRKYHLPIRDQIAFSTAHMLRAHTLAGVVFLSGCDKNVPGQLMAAAEVDMPCIFVTGGTMLPGKFRGQDIVCCTDGRRLIGEYEKGNISEQEYLRLIDELYPGVGACGTMGTANTMQAMTEALGLSLPGSANVPAVSARRYWFAEEAGRRIMDLVKQGITSRTILTKAALRNAITVLMAMGGSTNGILHLTAIARKAGISMDLETFEEISSVTPFLCDIKPSGAWTVRDFDEAGGVAVLEKELEPLLDLSVMTVTGKTLGENLKAIPRSQGTVIRRREEPIHPDGGIVVLRGNLAPEGAIIKKSAVRKELYKHTGPARVFDTYAEFEAMMHSGKVDFTAEHVVIIRNEGPRGAPGMPEILIPPNLYRHGLQDCVIITDGRTSGTQQGRLVVHVSPEARVMGPIGLLRNGDLVTLDIEARTLSVNLTPEELETRKADWSAPEYDDKSEWLRLYQKFASSASQGAMIDFDQEDR